MDMEYKIKYFNPHSHEGSDYFISYTHNACDNFNPHSHEGSDIHAKEIIRDRANFNPHSHEGSDGATVTGGSQAQGISIHTPTKGVTYCYCHDVSVFHISIHTPTKGVTQVQMLPCRLHSISIHTPTKGVTLLDLWQGAYIYDFNPHSHEGSDSEPVIPDFSIHGISIHTPTKGVTAILSNLGLLFFNFFHQFPN